MNLTHGNQKTRKIVLKKIHENPPGSHYGCVLTMGAGIMFGDI